MLFTMPEFFILTIFSTIYLIVVTFSKAKTYDLKKKQQSLYLLLAGWIIALASTYTINLPIVDPYMRGMGLSYYFGLLLRGLFVISLALSIFFMLVAYSEKPEAKEEETN